MNLSLVIPCYNEEKNIPLIFARLQEIFTQTANLEVILVNNGSTDHSSQVFADMFATYHNHACKLVNVATNRGYGFGILAGLQAATGDVLAWTHADLQTDLHDIVRAFTLYQQKNDPRVVVKGKRCQRPARDVIFTYGMQLLSNYLLNTKLNDINAQPKLFSRQFYETHLKANAPHDFSLDLYLLYQAEHHHFTIVEIPVYFNKRRFGEAKGGGSLKNKYKISLRTLKYILQLID